ncbi:MAG: cytochrome c oxidase assembly protein [Actinomycetota bacterium]|nr:cytochrome c oxidase assembly protein [Actinomycetota bacterium]
MVFAALSAGSVAAGYDGPPPLTPVRALTSWHAAPFLLAGVLLVGGLYLFAVRRLRRRGDAWSPWRSLSFLAGGLGSFVLATMSALGTYDTTLFSVHMAQHMVLTMVTPVTLALGAPVTLALRTLPAPHRQTLVKLLHSRVSAVLVNPIVGFALFVSTPFALYFTGFYEATLRSDYLHQMMHVHFVLVGCMFFWPLIGLDPVPGRLPYLIRLVVVFATLPFHAFLGVSIMGGTNLLAADYYRELARPWGPSPLEDQNIGGAILWAAGDIVGVVFLLALVVQWMLADQREATREDRRLDRLDAAAASAAARPPAGMPSSGAGSSGADR